MIDLNTIEHVDQRENPDLPLWLRKDLSNPEVAKDTLRENKYELVPYILQDGRKHKVAIICPGGGYNMIAGFLEGQPYAKALNAMGISAVVLYYRCREEALYPAPMDDLARALKEVMEKEEEWNLDMDGYSVWGSSAGGHLAAAFGTKNMGYAKYQLPKPGAIILTYPVITMGECGHEGTRNNLLGMNASEKMRDFASIEKQVDEDYPPVFVWCGLADSCVSPKNSALLADALKQAGVRYAYEAYDGVEHAVGLGKGLPCEGWIEKAVRFWSES